MSEFRRVERAVIEVIEGERPYMSGLREVVTYQEKWNENLRRYWAERSFASTDLETPSDVPAVPSDVFRHIQLVSSELKVARIYRTSGTTSGARGEHHRFGTNAYDLGARKHFRECVGVDRMSGLGIHFLPSPPKAADSSLVHMVADLSEYLECSEVFYLLDDASAAWARLDELSRRFHGGPVFVFGTAFAFAAWLDEGGKCPLPRGSVVVETGGFKSHKTDLTRRDYVEQLIEGFGASASYFSEYSMTELSSQGYGRLVPESATRYVFPRWCQVVACDPMTLEPLPKGELGILRFIDLCNVETCVSVQTEDAGVVFENGVELHGRLSDAQPRGCSLAAKEILESGR